MLLYISWVVLTYITLVGTCNTVRTFRGETVPLLKLSSWNLINAVRQVFRG